MDKNDPADSDLGELLHHPLEAVTLGNRGRDRALLRLGLADLLAGGPQSGTGHLGAPPPAQTIADRHHLTIAKAQDTKEVVGIVGLGHGRRERRDENVCRAGPQQGVHWNADLMRAKRPCSW